MNERSRWSRFARWATVVGASGLLPTTVMRCDKAALNFQRGLTQGLGHQFSEVLADELFDLGDSATAAEDKD
jgi:hypothetical protein